MAYMGINKGYKTVSEAIRDSEIIERVAEFWDEASQVLNNPSLDLKAYQDSLITRFSNPNIRHELEQIAIDGSMKLRERIIPIIKARMAKGSPTMGCKFVIAQWIEFVSNHEFKDVNSDLIAGALSSDNSTRELVAILDSELATNETYINSIYTNNTDRKNENAKTTI